MTNDPSHCEQRQRLIRIGQDFWNRGWSRGTSSNYSCVVDRSPFQLLITASGKDKGALTEMDFAVVDENGKAIDAKQPKSSAETLLHTWAAVSCSAGAILHTHSVTATVLSLKFVGQGGIWLEGFEMLKGLEGIATHEARVWLPIFKNSQDMTQLQAEVDEYWKTNDVKNVPGFLIAGHGMYAWGTDIPAAVRHVEVLEFLLECVAKMMSMR
jgi:methylthioribulose-1-phosphate dehydratase